MSDMIRSLAGLSPMKRQYIGGNYEPPQQEEMPFPDLQPQQAQFVDQLPPTADLMADPAQMKTAQQKIQNRVLAQQAARRR